MSRSSKLASVPTLSDLLADPTKLSALPREAIAQLRGELARLDTLLLSRLFTDDQAHAGNEHNDRLLDIDEAAGKLGLSRDALYRSDYPFVVRIGSRRRFTEKGIKKFIRARTGM